MLALLAVLALQAPEAARAESLLAAGALPAARAIAERLVARTPRDPRHHILLGRIWFAWPVIGRYPALAAFREAARLAPADPAPLYGQVEVGFYLGSDEGEVIAREALLRIFALDPDYRDTWTRFEQLFLNDAIARRADRALGRHGDHPLALERRARLAILLRESRRADSLAARQLAGGGSPIAAFLTHADAAFLDGRDAAGAAWYDSALARANRDSAGALWAHAWMVADPEETQRYAATPLRERERFFRAFWGVRDPNLLTRANERLGEHARRLAEARRQFRLLHPQRLVYRSATARALAWFDERRWLTALGPLQDTAHERASRAGLDARGLTFVRHGPPDLRMSCALDPRYPAGDGACTSGLDIEGWLYRTPAGVLSVGFRRAEYFDPASPEQLRHVTALLETDGTALPAPTFVRAWTAFFRGDATGYTDVYARAAADAAACVLWDKAGDEVAHATGPGVLLLRVRAGRYRVGVDVDSTGSQGRLRDTLTVPWFAPGDLAVSSLVLAADTAPTDRAGLLAAMPADLAYQAGAAFGAYAEIYGLAPVAGAARYRARYTFAPVRSLFGRLTRGTDPVSFEFERVAPSGGVVAERLVLEPGRVPPGRYRVTLAVTDLERNVKSETVALVVTLR
jgi:hypothetical protein